MSGRAVLLLVRRRNRAPREPDRIRDARTRLISLLDSAAPQPRESLGRVAARAVSRRGREVEGRVAAALACDDGDLAVWDACWVRVSRCWGLRAGGQRIPGGACRDAGAGAVSVGGHLAAAGRGAAAISREACGDAARVKFERRVWWLARPLFATPANDARTEHYARVTMARC
jgi:hypothetical protein